MRDELTIDNKGIIYGIINAINKHDYNAPGGWKSYQYCHTIEKLHTILMSGVDLNKKSNKTY